MLSPADIPGILRRRLPLILAIALTGAMITYGVVVSQPRAYESAAVLQVELPRVSTDAGRSVLVSRSAQRLQLLEQELLSREALLSLGARYQLFEDMPGLTESERVAVLRGSIRIETVRASGSSYGGDQPVSAMIIFVRLGAPQVAADVANELAAKVLELTTERQSAEVRETLSFYAAEEARLGQAIAALEAEITAYKNTHLDALPEGMQSRREEVARSEVILRELDTQLIALRQELRLLTASGSPRVIEQRQISALESQIASLEGQRGEVIDRRTAVEAAMNRAPAVETELGTFSRRLQQLQDQYSVINRRRAEAETSQRLDTERQTERFALLEKALPPDYAVASGRRKIFMLGMGASLGLGLGLAYLLELLNPVLRSARALERDLKLRPVIVLPEFARPVGRSGPRTASKKWLLGLMGALVAAGALVAQQILRRTGG